MKQVFTALTFASALPASSLAQEAQGIPEPAEDVITREIPIHPRTCLKDDGLATVKFDFILTTDTESAREMFKFRKLLSDTQKEAASIEASISDSLNSRIGHLTYDELLPIVNADPKQVMTFEDMPPFLTEKFRALLDNEILSGVNVRFETVETSRPESHQLDCNNLPTGRIPEL